MHRRDAELIIPFDSAQGDNRVRLSVVEALCALCASAVN
jgi:hypothetical protein